MTEKKYRGGGDFYMYVSFQTSENPWPNQSETQSSPVAGLRW
jgi:hypothetical protein